MSAWDSYTAIETVRGATRRNASLIREQRYIRNKIVNSLNYHKADINGIESDVAIVDTDLLNTKFIYSMPGEDILLGSIVYWNNNFWIVIEKDESTEVYCRAKMLQCNYLLKWVDDEDIIREQWCFIEDGTKYLTGEFEDRDFIVARGDSRIAITISRTEHTVKLNRESRFLIDDEDSPHKLAYILSKPLKLNNVHNGHGVFKFVLQEVNTTDDDNQELGIADYYKHFPTQEILEDHAVNTEITPETTIVEPQGVKMWL